MINSLQPLNFRLNQSSFCHFNNEEKPCYDYSETSYNSRR